FSPPLRASDNPDIDYVILTDTNLVSSFVPLRDWLRKTGLWTEIRTTQWVDNNYSGRDLPEKIRNFIKNYFQTQGLKYVLLGGDGDYNNPVVPTRQAGPLTVGGSTRFIACDLYYADLDWSWNGDNDTLFGEWTGDTVDLYHDVYIGRVPVENASHINNFITKLFKYLKTPDTTYQKKLLLPGALLWSGYNHMQSQESIANLSPSGWTDRLLDQGTNTGRRYEVRDSINQKFHFVHLVAHGNYEGSWITSGTPQYHRIDCGQQTNTNALCIINAISCMPGAFDSAVSPSCLAESALNAPNAAIGVMMNTRYGWGSPPYIGYSELLDVRFYHYFFTMDSVRFAPCHQSSKEFYRNYALNLAQVWRWCYYELTLFGEPSMLMWKDYPKRMVAYFPHTIPTGNQVFPCTVRTLTGTPVEQALVCLWKGDEIYQTGYTNSNGIVIFNINPTSAGYMYVTATKPNYIPYEDSSEVVLISYDVAVTEIISPTGIVDSGATITPQAKIKNFGIYPASFQAIFRIGTFYNQQMNVNLNPNDSVIVSFPNWQANQRGSHIVKCTVAYANDQRPENNSLIDSVFVRVLDVAVLEIISPTGTVDSGTNVTPRAKVKNFGNVNSSFVARFRIGTFYNQQVNVNLNPNDSVIVSFPNWQANQRGTHLVKCTVALTGDRIPNNNYQQTNVYVRVLDVGVTQIVSPQGNIDSGVVITPQARVKNYGNENSNFKVKFIIGNFYLDSLTIGLAPDRETLLNFTPWQANQLGTHTVKCTTLLIGDLNPYNNYQTGQVTVGYKDVGIIQINTPSGVIDSPGTITPQVVVKNFGSLPVSFPIYFKIIGPSSYFNSQTVLNLMPNEERQVNFAFWQVGLRGDYLATCSLNLSGDRNPDNDKLDTTFTVQVKDIGILSILSPKGIIDSGNIIKPEVSVKNYGSVALSFKTILKIPPIYSDSQETNLNSGEETTLVFNNFLPETTGLFFVNCSLRISDVNVVNNVKRETLFIAGVGERDVGVLRIIAPLYYGVSGEIRPLAVVKNFSPTPQSFKVFFKVIDSTNNNLLYFESTFVFNLAPNYSKDVAFPIWRAQVGLYSLTCSTYIPKDINSLNDVVKGYVKIEASLPEHWNLLRDLPLGPSSKKVKGGAALTFLRPNFIYAFKGNKTTEFYCYDITTGNWEKKTDIPYAAEKRKPVGNGGALTSDLERYVYAIKGNNTLEFWRYDAINDQWERLPDIPLGSKRVKDGAGLAYVKKGDSSFVYLLKGSKTNEFYAYYIEGNIWLNKEPAPFGPSNKPFNKGSAITFDNKENIYAIKGGEFEFYAYNINNGIWQRKADLPMFYNNRLKKNKQGCALTANWDGIVFAFRGNNTLDFLAYYPEENQWYHKEPIPVYPSDKKVKDGGALTYSFYNNMIYAFKGNNTNEFWCYLFYEALAKGEEIKKKESKQDEITNLIKNKRISKYEIYDIQGRKVKEIRKKGLYLLKIYDNNYNLKTIKIIKIK
ncbi:MAG: C25 family cysteine peptidase, partial [candidate division WOR-3 bacterium]